MTRLILLVPLAALSGCIIYDTQGKCHGCGWDDKEDWWEDTGATGDDPTADDSGGDTPVEAVWALDPDVGEVGSTFIASLTGGDGFDYGTVADVQVYGDAALLASDIRDDEVLLTFSIPADAAVGAADLLVVRADGTADFLDDVLTIVAAGSGGSDDGSGGSDDGSGGSDGSGDGSGGSDDGSGGTDTGSGSGCP